MSPKLSVILTLPEPKARVLHNNHLTFLCSCNFIFPGPMSARPVQEMFLERVKINCLPVAPRQAEQAAFLWVISPPGSRTWDTGVHGARSSGKQAKTASEIRHALLAIKCFPGIRFLSALTSKIWPGPGVAYNLQSALYCFYFTRKPTGWHRMPWCGVWVWHVWHCLRCLALTRGGPLYAV